MASSPPDHAAGKSLSDLRRLVPSYDFEPVKKVLNGDSDSAAALLAASQLDFTLQETISEFFVASASDKNERLFGEAAPLGSTMAKAHLCYALGIIGPVTRDDIVSICYVRNLFAHTVVPLDFKVEAIRNKCTSMAALTAYEAADIYHIVNLPFSKTDGRMAFINTCLGISFMVSVGRKMQPDGSIKFSVNLKQPDLP
jgi:hypothetical protein